MSVRSVVSRFKNVGKWFNNMSYSSVVLKCEEIDLDKYLARIDSDAKKRIRDIEYSKHNAKHVFKLSNKKGILTVNQIRDFFDKLEFNVDATLGEQFDSDVMLVYNLGGYIVPFYKVFLKVAKAISEKLFFFFEKRMAPGVSRLHARLYQESDGSWICIFHVDKANWLNILNPVQLFKSHLEQGTGDYERGFEVMKKAFKRIVPRFNKRKNFYVDIGRIYSTGKY